MHIEDYETNTYEAIEEYKNLVKKKEAEIKELEIIKDSLTDSLLRKVRSIVLPYMGDMMEKAFHQQNLKKKSERSAYEWIKKRLIEDLFDESRRSSVKLENIVSYGYEGYGYNFIFSYNKTKFELFIPEPQKANRKNIKYIWYGQYALSYEHKPSIWHHISASYKLEDIARELEEFLLKGENADE